VSIPRINLKFRAACIAADRSLPQAGPLADDFFEAISAVPFAEGNLAFDAVVADIERLPANRAFEPMMIAGEALAACLLQAPEYGDVVRRWLLRDHASARTTGMRAYSKVADYDFARIDGDAVAALVARLDQMSPLSNVDEVTLGYIGRMAGKLRDEATGIRIIEQLASQGVESRVAATHAIAFDIALAPSVSKLSVFARLGPARVRRDPPNRRLSWLFNSLRHDADPKVAAAAEYNMELIRHSWPETWKRMIELRAGQAVTADESADQAPVQYRDAANANAAVDDALADFQARTGRHWTRAALATLTHADLARERAAQPRGVDFALRFPGESNQRQGVLTWDRELLEEEARALAASNTLPHIIGAPRLFLSYRWSNEIAEVGLIDMLAGRLHMSGYDIVFDRDPRYLDKGLSAGDVLLLLYSCTHFVPLITAELLEFLARWPSNPKTPIELEWELARSRERASTPLRWLAAWLSGDRLPKWLMQRLAVDMREAWLDAFDRVFPPCRFEVTGIKKGGVRGKSSVVSRRDLRDSIETQSSKRGYEGVEVRDVTRRPKLWQARSAASRP
jgi:hypothetical protein